MGLIKLFIKKHTQLYPVVVQLYLKCTQNFNVPAMATPVLILQKQNQLSLKRSSFYTAGRLPLSAVLLQ